MNLRHGILVSLVRFCVRCPFVATLLLGALRPVRKWPISRLVWLRIRQELIRAAEESETPVTRTVRIVTGARMKINIADHHNCMYFEKVPYEPATTRFFLEHLHSSDVVVDVGANQGYFSLLSASIVGPSGKVHAFEANPALKPMLEDSIGRNDFRSVVHLSNVGLSDEAKEVPLYLPETGANIGSATMHPWAGHLEAGTLNESRFVNVVCVRFDDWIKTHPLLRIDLVKIDVEGAELEVLKGMRESLRRFQPLHIVCETGLSSEVSVFICNLGYSAEPLELHDEQSKWGNILFRREAE